VVVQSKMKRTNNITKMVSLLVVPLTALGNKAVLSQEKPLKNGITVVGGMVYNIVISSEYRDIYIHNRSADSITNTLINPELGTTNISEDFIFVNTDKLLEIKRRFYPQNAQMDIRVILTRAGGLIGLEYVLPKSPMITEQEFRELDAQVRKHLKISVVFPNEWVKNQKYNGYATRYEKLE